MGGEEWVGKKGEMKKEKKRKKEKEKKEGERKRKVFQFLFRLEILNLYPSRILNFQLRFHEILIVFLIFDNYETSSNFRVSILN